MAVHLYSERSFCVCFHTAIIFCGMLAVGMMTSACDMPPNDSPSIDTDTETESEVETDTGTEQETDTQATTTCFESMLCAAMNPDQALLCLEGLGEDNQAAAIDLSLCAADTCADSISNILSFGICLFQNCPDQAEACIGASFLEVYY